MLYHCYVRKSLVFVPTVAKVERGGPYSDVEPVAVVPVSDTAGLRHAFRETIARGNPIVPVVLRYDLPPPILLKYAGVKNWSAFARGTVTWGIIETDGAYRIIGYRKRADRGWEQDPDQVVKLPPGSSVDEVIERMIAIVQAKDRE
jgi:hypothetical protein